MRLTASWFAVVGTVILAVGLMLALTGQSRSSTGLVLLAGCLFWVAFLVINELTQDGREPPPDTEQRSGIPWGKLWPFIAMLAIVLATLLVVRILA